MLICWPIPSLDAGANMEDILEPYKNFRFRVVWDGRPVAGVSRIGALRRTTEVVRHTEGGDPNNIGRKSPGKTEFEAITLQRGVTQDRAFEAWANQVWTPSGRQTGRDFRKDVQLELYDDQGRMVLAYRLHRCWVSEYQALPDLDAAENAVAIESIRLEVEAWERQDSTLPSGPDRGAGA